LLVYRDVLSENDFFLVCECRRKHKVPQVEQNRGTWGKKSNNDVKPLKKGDSNLLQSLIVQKKHQKQELWLTPKVLG